MNRLLLWALARSAGVICWWRARKNFRCGLPVDAEPYAARCQRVKGHRGGEHCGVTGHCDYEDHNDRCVCKVPTPDWLGRCRCGGFR